MSINLVDLAKQAVTGQVMDQLGGLIGADRQKTESAVGAAIPTILGGLLKKSTTPQGTEDVLGSLKDFDGGIADNLGGMLSGGDHQSLIEKGIRLITMLFGSNQGGIIETIGRMSGIGGKSSSSLMGMLAPIVMSMISKQSPASGFSAGGLTELLMSQKNHIADAMPQELSGQLGIGDMLGQGAEAFSGVAATAGDAAHAAAGQVENAGGGLMKLLLPVGILAALGIAAWSFLSGNGQDLSAGASAVRESAENVTEQAGTALDGAGINSAMLDMGSMKTEVTSMFGGLTKSISGISDVESAKAALPEISEAASSWDKLNLDALPATAKTGLGGVISPLLEKIKSALESAYAIPGVQGILEPKVGPLMEKFESFAA